MKRLEGTSPAFEGGGELNHDNSSRYPRIQTQIRARHIPNTCLRSYCSTDLFCGVYKAYCCDEIRADWNKVHKFRVKGSPRKPKFCTAVSNIFRKITAIFPLKNVPLFASTGTKTPENNEIHSPTARLSMHLVACQLSWRQQFGSTF